MITTEVLLAAISLISAVSSGYLLYKTNISKDNIQANKNEMDEQVTLLESEGKFRLELMAAVDKLKVRVEQLDSENIKLRAELREAKEHIENLKDLLKDKIDKTNVISGFLKHLPNPAWIKVKDSDSVFKIAFVNSNYCFLFGVSEEYAIGREKNTGVSEECLKILDELTAQVLKYKRGVKSTLPISGSDAAWCVLKFPVIENGDVIAIGGILMDYLEKHNDRTTGADT